MHLTSGTDDQARVYLANVATQRDPDALAQLYDMFAPQAYALGAQMLRDPMLAEEVVQEAFFKVWRLWRTYDAQGGSVRAWVFGIMHNGALDALHRQQSRRARHVALDHTTEALLQRPDIWGEVACSLDQQRVRASLADLPEAQRAVVVLASFGGCSQAQIAHALNVPLGTVNGRLRLAMEKLRSSLLEPDPAG